MSQQVADIPVVGGGDTALTFEAFYRQEYRRLVTCLVPVVSSRWLAEEVAQEAFASAYRRWGRLEGYDAPAAWVRRVAMNQAISRFRRARTEAAALLRLDRERPPELPDGPSSLFVAAVRALPPAQRQVVALFYFDDMSVEGIATLLDRAPGTVRAQLHQARRTLATRLETDRSEDA